MNHTCTHTRMHAQSAVTFQVRPCFSIIVASPLFPEGPQPLSAACAASKLSPPRFSPFTHQRPFWVMAFPFPKPLGPPPAAFHRSTVSGGAHEALHGGSQRAGEVPASCWGTPPVASLLPFRAVTCSSLGPSLWGSFSDHLCVHSSGGLVHKSAC